MNDGPMTHLAPAPRLTLIRTRVATINTPLEQIHEFEIAIEKHTSWSVVRGLPAIPPIKATSRLVFVCGLCLDWLLRRLGVNNGGDYLCIGYLAPHYLIYKTFPYFSIPSRTRLLWMYDAWESQLEQIESVIRKTRITSGFFSSLQATNHFNGLSIDNFKAHWIPEGITVADYRSKPSRERTIDIIQLGRRWNDYHWQIAAFCEEHGLTYLYETTPGQIIFSTRELFLEGLAKSKISICVPSAITHPRRSGRISTMTWRYLQSMASRCLILGKMPHEMQELFDYDPIVEIDLADPCGQLRSILDSFEIYSELIERNYLFVEKHHQWRNRILSIEACLDDDGRNERYVLPQ